uniref:Leptin receptor n=1 Tax=Channa punctata TaxID=304456 RepID=A0A4P8GJP2_CHAPF|nr:leptin receptor [Channa punctata]
MLTVLMQILLVTHAGAQGLESGGGAALHYGVLDLPWQDELCCDSPSGRLTVEGGSTHAPEKSRFQSNLPHRPRCSFRSSKTKSHPPQPSGGICLDILCRVDENWGNITCDLQSHSQPFGNLETGRIAVSLQRLLSHEGDLWVEDESASSDNPVICEALDSFMCSVAFDSTTSFVTMVTISISDAVAPQVLLRIPARPEKPGPPVNLSHVQTIEADLIVMWDDPSDFDAGTLRYQIRYSSNSTHPAWHMVSTPRDPRLSLDLKPRLNYTIQVRCSGLDDPPLWSNWSEPYHIYLDTVSYIPEKVIARPGEYVDVYCVFNDHSINASSAVWMLNFQEPLHRNQYHPVNQWVSQVTVRPSESRMYDLLQCTQEWTIPYSQIYVEGASIDIKCETNGDIDAMDCSWKNTQWTKPTFQSRWADLPCDVMEERERAGETVGEMAPACLPVGSRQKSCTIQPLRMNCYKLWLEVPSRLGPIRSRPIYLSPIDYVKPHTPTNVKAESLSSGVLVVSWEPPPLPVEGLQCQFRYHSPSTARAQQEWKVQSPVRAPQAEISVPDMCRVYVVQVRCMHVNGTGYWSDWTDSVYSTPQNSRAPERGPDFWRILQDEPYRNQTNVTLLFEQMPISGPSYCVDGFIIQLQASSGTVMREQIEVVSSYSFEWNQDLHTVTVEAYNNIGSSTNNINMTLENQPKRRCVQSFRVLVINSTCVSLSWSLLDNSSAPLFMVVQWLPQTQQDSDLHKRHNGGTWARLSYTDRPVYLRGDFFASEEYVFHLYPVFADGEGEPMYTTAARRDPAVYMMLMIISFLSVVLFVTLVISQNQMRSLVWKDVPNPNKCSWAKGLDFKKADNFDHLFQPVEGLQAWPLLLPSENISKVIVVEKADLSDLTTALIQTPLVSLSSDPAVPLTSVFDSKDEQTQFMNRELLLEGAASLAVNLDALNNFHPEIDELQSDPSPEVQPPGSTVSSAQSSVTYATVLISHPKQDQQHICLRYKDGSGSSSSDEGNFSANNSDISGSFPGGLWELDSCRGGESEDQRRSCSYNSVEELSETSEQEDEGGTKEGKNLYYLGMDYPAEDEDSEEEEEQREEETKIELLKIVVPDQSFSGESRPLLGSGEPTEPLSASTCGFTPLYLPQFRTVPCTNQLQDSKAQI